MKANFKKQGIKALGLLLLTAVLVLLPQKQVKALENYTLKLDDNFVWGNIAVEKDIHRYTFSISQPSWVTITFQGHSVGDCYYKLRRADLTGNDYFSHEVWTSSDVAPKTSSDTQALEAGTYIVEINAYGNHTGKYQIKGSSRPCGNTEMEPNNSFAEAQALTQGALVKGLFSADDRIDFYKVQLNSTQKLHFYMVNYMYDVYFTFYDANYYELSNQEIWNASEQAPKTADYAFTWDPGIYYVKVTPTGNNQGVYTIKFERDVLASSISVSGKGQMAVGTEAQMTAKFSPSNTTDKTVQWSSGNSSIASVDSNGKVHAYRPGKTTITAMATDGSNVKSTVALIVTPGKVNLNYTYVQSRKKKQLYVAWGAQYNVSGYEVQYSTSSKFKGAKKVNVSKSRNYTTLKKLKSGKKYYVRVRSYVKVGGKKYYSPSWSNKKSARVR